MVGSEGSSAGYFDAASGLPLHPVAVEAYEAALADGWADPAKLGTPGRRSAVLLDAARELVADILGCRPDEASFVPSGSHALHLAVLGSVAGRARAGTVLVHSAVEHSAVLHAAQWHQSHGGQVRTVGVDDLGRVAVTDFLKQASRGDVATAVLQAANHEVGTRQPVEEISATLPAGVPLVVDAAHDIVYGTPPTSASIFTADARLWGGPAGVGILVVRRGTRWHAPFPADQAEGGRSPGAPNVPAIVAAAASLHATRTSAAADATRLRGLVDELRARLSTSLLDADGLPTGVILGDPMDRLPHLLTVSLLHVDGTALLTELDRLGITVSSGSSCTSDTVTPSHVLVAMGALTSGNVRISLPPTTTQPDVDALITALGTAIRTVRADLPVTANPAPVLPQPPESTATTIVDSRGRRCPLPVLDLARTLPSVDIGAEVLVLADDPAASSDIAAWCRMRRQELVDASNHGEGTTAFRVRRLH